VTRRADTRCHRARNKEKRTTTRESLSTKGFLAVWCPQVVERVGDGERRKTSPPKAFARSGDGAELLLGLIAQSFYLAGYQVRENFVLGEGENLSTKGFSLDLMEA
jgi:hypothetical protein